MPVSPPTVFICVCYKCSVVVGSWHLPIHFRPSALQTRSFEPYADSRLNLAHHKDAHEKYRRQHIKVKSFTSIFLNGGGTIYVNVFLESALEPLQIYCINFMTV